MGLVLCKKHGESGLVLSCPHLAKLALNFKETSEFVKRVETIGEKTYPFSRRTYVFCVNCDNEYKETTIGKLSPYFLKPVCGKCFIELSNLDNWD